jgi:glucosyl-3-phosphoglycerate synthase
VDTIVAAACVDAPVDCERELARWFARRRYRSAAYTPARVLAAKGLTQVTVIVPVRECAQTIGAVIEVALAPALAAGIVDELVVVDAASADGSGEIARAAGARVVQQDEIARAVGPALGKGDAMWRGLQITGGDVVCFMDGDTCDPDPAHLLGLLGPLLEVPELALVKGAFERPFDAGRERLAHEGGRVTELMARPLLNLHAPLLAGFAQPLAGELAARRELLEDIPFAAGYGVETAMLLDALARCGLDALAECDLGTRQNRHQPLRSLGEMAYAVLAALELRRPGATAPSGRYVRPWDGGGAIAVPVIERPPLRARTAGRRRAAQA